MVLAIIFYGFNHRYRIGKFLCVGIDKTAKSLLFHGISLQFSMLKHVSIRRIFFFPFLATTLIEPHATDVFQKTCSAIDATFVRKIKSKTFVSDNGFRQFYAHQAPCSRAEISKFPVLCRHGGNGRSRIMPCHGNDRHFT